MEDSEEKASPSHNYLSWSKENLSELLLEEIYSTQTKQVGRHKWASWS